MRILKIQTLRGPNYWSIRRHKLIVMRLDLENLAETPSNEIPGFYEGLVEALPSLEGHYCSPGCRGGFLMRVREGTMMGHIVEHVALELQELVGMHVGFGRTRETSTPGVYQVVFEYLNEEAGRYAGRAAVRLCQSIVDRGRYPKAELEQDLQDLKDLWRDAALGPSTESIVKEAEKKGIPWMQLGARFLIQLGYGVNQKRIQATMTDKTGILGVELACDKEATKRVLANAGVPVPKGTVINFLDDLEEAIEYVGGYPIVIKPLDGNHGRGITIDIQNWQEAEAAYDAARQVSRSIIVERYYQGRDHRVLVVDGKVVAVAERVPAHVIGDGRSSIAELIEETNKDPNRGEGHDNVLTKIELDRTSYQLLERQGYTLDSVLSKDEICYLRATANLSTGGIAVDRTDEIHPENVWLAQRVVKIVGLDIAGIDVVTSDISRPLREVDGVIVEVNAAPGFRMHVAPSQGTSRNVAGSVIEMLFPNEQSSRIPILSVTGTNGKTTTTRLLAHIFKQTGKVIGYTTTDGTYIGDYLVEAGDNTGPQSAQLILQDPTVEVAVLETARGGIVRSGLAFEAANVGVVLNVAADHLGLSDIDTIDQLAHLKSVVAEAVFPDGYAVLNADDPRVAAMAERTKANIAYFTMNPNSELVRNHIQKGGVAAVYENGFLSILKGDWTHRIERAENIPLTMGGRAPFMIANALAASLAAFVQNVSIEQIRAGLNTFRASVSQTPGRMNLFNLGNFHALVDYAHNPHSYEALGSFVRNWTNGERIGVVGGPGDRRDQDFIALGKLAAEIFDYVIIKEDDDTRGRTRGSAADLIVQGIKEVNPNYKYELILDETQAINKALDIAPENSLVVILPESVSRAIKLIRARGVVKEEIHQQTTTSNTTDSQVGVTSSVVNTVNTVL
ncbi:MAG: cyanophycin synthetase [Chlorogloeopsis fritschii C42_A2020_084]|jgi:cyanophycin synthetase|uniref:cyanophycin synthetase n=1 Tax=Chlorogloeopsis fritschii TaxID=1124 RepID=UPI001A011142|nr:cyanophycin synthetase [Chlorogloeopsis fritschii]MBF2005428.1 cyanophycin synthetase [Chlorogloeopsis fritschii C42_A2020_084]